MHPGKVLLWQSAPSVPIFFVLSALFETQAIQLDIIVLSAVLYQGLVVAGFCFILLTSLLNAIRPPPLGFWVHHPNCRRHRQAISSSATPSHPPSSSASRSWASASPLSIHRSEPLPKRIAYQSMRSHYTPQEKTGFRTRCRHFTRAEYPATQNHRPCLQSTVQGARGTAPSPSERPVINVIRLFVGIIRRIEKQPIIIRRTGVFPSISHHHSPPRLVHSMRMHLSGNLLQIRRIGFRISIGLALELSGIAGNTVTRIIVPDHILGNGNTAKTQRRRRNIHVIDHRIGRSPYSY